MATETLPQAADAAATVSPLRINLADKTLSGRSVVRPADSLRYADAVELPFGDYGRRVIPDAFPARGLVRLELRSEQWMPVFAKEDTLIFDLSLTPEYGDIVLVGKPGEAAYICRYERGDRDETAYNLYSALQSFGEQMHPLPVWGVAVEHIETARPDDLSDFAVTRRPRKDKSFAYDVTLTSDDFVAERLIDPFPASVPGSLTLAPNLGVVKIGPIFAFGDITIGEGTTLDCESARATGKIHGGGSIKTRQSIEANSLSLAGDVICGLHIDLERDLFIGGTLDCVDPVKAKSAEVRGNAKITALVMVGALNLHGNAEIGAIEAAEVTCGGNLSCEWYLHANDGIDVSGDLHVGEELRAGLFITAGGTIHTGGRFFAGLADPWVDDGGKARASDRTITCKSLLTDTLAYGILIENEPHQRPSPVSNEHLSSVLALTNQRFIDTKDELWRESRDAVSELLRVRRVVADARKGLDDIHAMASSVRVEEAPSQEASVAA